MTEYQFPRYISVDANGDPIGSGGGGSSTIINTTANPIPIKPFAVISTVNSTSTPLAGNATFTGTGEDVKDYGVISIAIYSSHVSATNGLEFQFSPNNTDWYTTDNYSYSSTATVKNYSLSPVARYFRVKYTNGATLQTSFFIETSYRQTYVKPSSHRVLDSISLQDDSEVVSAVLMARNNADIFTDVHVTNGGNLKVSIEETNGSTDFATQTTLSAINTKVPSLGQALASGSVPVVLTASQLSTLTPVSTVTANAGTNLNTSLLALESGGNLASINNKLNSQVVSSSTVTTVNAVASDTTLLASNANRKGFIIFNNSTAILYVLLATGTSSSTNFSILLNQNESLIIDNTCLYTGVVKGIWASAAGDCKVTEFS